MEPTQPQRAVTHLIIDVQPQPAAITVALRGSADLSGVEELERKLTIILAQRPAHLIFDLVELSMISSICMGTLVRTKHAVERTGGKVTLAGAHGIVLEALQRARLTDLFRIEGAGGSASRADQSQ